MIRTSLPIIKVLQALRSEMTVSRRTLFSVTARYGVCGAAVYWTAKHGIWGSQEDSEHVYQKAAEISKQYLKQLENNKYGRKVFIKLEPPSTDQFGKSAGVYWNKGVQKSFSSLNNLGKTIQYYAKTGTEQVEKLWKNQTLEEKLSDKIKGAGDKQKNIQQLENVTKFVLSNNEYVEKGWVLSGETEQIKELSQAQITELLQESVLECKQIFEKHYKDLTNEFIKEYIVWRFGHSRKLTATIFSKQKTLEEPPKSERLSSLVFFPQDDKTNGSTQGSRTPHNDKIYEDASPESRPKSVSSIGHKSGTHLPSKVWISMKPFLMVRMDLPGRNLKETKLLKGTWSTLKKALRIATYDGTDCIYYPSGRPAILCTGYVTSNQYAHHYVYDDKPNIKILAIISPPNDCTCYASDGRIRFHISETNGIYISEMNKDLVDYEMPMNRKSQDRIELCLNENISLHYKKSDGYKLVYQTATDYLALNLSKEPIFLPMEYLEIGNKQLTPLYKSAMKEQLPDPKEIINLPNSVMDYSNKTLSEIYEHLKIHQEQISNIIKNLQITVGVDRRPWLQEKVTEWRHLSIEELTKQAKIEEKTGAIMEELPVTLETVSAKEAKYLMSEKEMAESKLNYGIQDTKLIAEMPLKLHHHRSTPVCTVVLRQKIIQELELPGRPGTRPMKTRLPNCECSSTEIPFITDIEIKEFIDRHAPAEQIVVICITSFKKPETKAEKVLTNIYSLINKSRRKPCLTFPPDCFKILRYDLAKAFTDTAETRSFLARQHDVSEGMVLMYIAGKLVFCDTQFNGYGMNERNFSKQINETYKRSLKGFCFPEDFKFR